MKPRVTCAPGAGALDPRGGEGEVHELHRRGLALGRGPIGILLGGALDAFAVDHEEGGFLDAAELAENILAPHRIVDLDHEGGDQFAAVGNERVVGLELAPHLLRPTLLDVDHLVHL